MSTDDFNAGVEYVGDDIPTLLGEGFVVKALTAKTKNKNSSRGRNPAWVGGSSTADRQAYTKILINFPYFRRDSCAPATGSTCFHSETANTASMPPTSPRDVCRLLCYGICDHGVFVVQGRHRRVGRATSRASHGDNSNASKRLPGSNHDRC